METFFLTLQILFPPHQQKLILRNPKPERTSSDVSCDDVTDHVRIKVVNGSYRCWIVLYYDVRSKQLEHLLLGTGFKSWSVDDFTDLNKN